MMGNVADTKTRSDVVDLPLPKFCPDIPSDISPQKQEFLRLLFGMEPNRMAAALRMIRLFLDRQEAGMSREEANRLMWQEAVDDGRVDRDAVPPEVQLAAAE